MPVPKSLVVLGASALVAALLAAPGPVSATPDGWDPITAITGTSGQFNHSFATAPDGTSLVLWAAPGTESGGRFVSRVQLSGRDDWRRVPTGVDNQYNLQNEVLAAAPDGDFWLTFVQYGEFSGVPEVYVMRFDQQRLAWTKKSRVFHQPNYDHAAPTLAVGGDGSVYIGAVAEPVEPGPTPAYRTIVARLAPGSSTWKPTFLSPAGSHSSPPRLAANGRGQVAAMWIQGYALNEFTVHGAHRMPGRTAPWHQTALSPAGDTQYSFTALALGAGGRAAIVWGSPSQGPITSLKMAYVKVRTGDPVWGSTTVASGGTGYNSPLATVGSTGDITVLWRQPGTATAQILEARTMSGTTWGVVEPLSPDGQISELDALVTRTNGRAVVLYQLFLPGTPLVSQGLRLRELRAGGWSGADEVSDAADDVANQENLGVTASGGTIASWAMGFPGIALVTTGTTLGKPDVVRDAYSNHQVGRARVKGPLIVDTFATCISGYWVEASRLRYAWSRDGHPIAGQDGRRYLVGASDRTHRLACRVVASNASGLDRTLRSRGRHVPG